MGTITITVEAGAAGTVTKTFNVTNAKLGNLVDFAKTLRSTNEGELTNAQAMERWAQWVFEMTRVHVVEHNRRTATVADFDATP